MKTEKDVAIEINTIQIAEDMEEQRSVLRVSGKMFEKEKTRYLFYEEPSEDLDIPEKVRIILEHDRVKLKKSGNAEWEMEFAVGKEWNSPYYTAFGTIQTRIHTSEMELAEKDDELTLKVSYHLILQESYAADCRMVLRITPAIQ